MAYALMIHPTDNVAVVTEAVRTGEDVLYEDANGGQVCLKAAGDVPVYHKIALRDIAPGEKVLKYGKTIGVATAPIAKGEHVHCHNIESPERKELI